MMGAMIGPDLVIGLGGFGDSVSDALRDMADYFDKHSYSISDNRVEVAVYGKRHSQPAQCQAFERNGKDLKIPMVNF